uniref:R-spondin Fu-CRD domain-containing protein n=1 Tax=Cairina moschata TaxID=8855 RepID=A0A8C3CB94_CAIMO
MGLTPLLVPVSLSPGADPPGTRCPRAGRRAAGAAGEAAAALEPPDRSLSRLHLNVSETLFVPLTYNRQQPINPGQGSFLPAGCSGGQRPVGYRGTAARGARAGTRSCAQWGGTPRPCRAPRRSPSALLVSAVSAGLFENCTGCVLCSEDNGCITCHHRLFLLIWRDGIRQYGMCVHTCPPGYFGVRGLEVNRCTSTWCVSVAPAPPSAPGSPRCPSAPLPTRSCVWEGRRLPLRTGAGGSELAPSSQHPFPAECRSPSCESCFSKDFCMKCKEKFYLHKGQCFRQCPPGTAAQPGTRECQETCEPGPWGEWSACTHEGRTCGCKWGLETRVREVLGAPREEGASCPALLETRKCRLRKHCPGGERGPACPPQPPGLAPRRRSA